VISIDTYFVTAGAADGRKVIRPDPSSEFVGAIPYSGGPERRYELPQNADDVARAFGPRVYRAMLVDPAVNSSFNSLRLSILDGGIHFKPSHDISALYRKSLAMKKGKGGGAEDGEFGEPSLSPELRRSIEICKFVERCISRVEDSLHAEMLGLLESLAFGVKLAETTLGFIEHGEDAGRYGIASFRVKPDHAWRFIVDRALNVKGVLAIESDDGRHIVASPEKFSWMSWMPRDGDPRGTSAIRAAYDAWNSKIQQWPSYYRYLKRFGSPGIVAAMAEGDRASRPDVDADGNEVVGTSISPSQHMVKLLQLYQDGGVIAVPFGTEVKPFEPQSNGEAFLSAFDLYDRQIVLAIQMQVRASLEAKHGSKADSDTAENVKGLVIPFGRNCLAATLRKAIRFLVAANFGEEDADLYLPRVSLGKAEQQDKATLWGAVGGLWSSGYLGESQRNELDVEVGLPPRDSEADAASTAEAKLAAQQDSVGNKVAPPIGGATKKIDDGGGQ
jgi:hypothetical protein